MYQYKYLYQYCQDYNNKKKSDNISNTVCVIQYLLQL